MAEVVQTEADLLQYGGGRIELGNNLKIVVLFPIGGAIVVMGDGGQDNALQGNPFLLDGGEDDELLLDHIQHEGGEDTT